MAVWFYNIAVQVLADWPEIARKYARFTATVVFPVPPLPLAIAIFISSSGYALVMAVPQLGHFCSIQGMPLWCGPVLRTGGRDSLLPVPKLCHTHPAPSTSSGSHALACSSASSPYPARRHCHAPYLVHCLVLGPVFCYLPSSKYSFLPHVSFVRLSRRSFICLSSFSSTDASCFRYSISVSLLSGVDPYCGA